MAFFIEKIVASGAGKKESTIVFKPGANIIYGPSNTGKTYIVKCIDFLFGSDADPFDSSSGYDSFVSEFGKWIKLFLEDCKYPNLTSLIFDKATMDIVLNGKKKSANGKGYNAYLNSAVAIVLSRYMQKHAHYAPGLILLDSPILSLKEIDTQKPSQSMRSGLFENIASTSEGIQTIVIENEIPEIDYSNVNLIHFTKNANTGRYGFLIDVMD